MYSTAEDDYTYFKTLHNTIEICSFLFAPRHFRGGSKNILNYAR
jgi:hypothetical protein